MCGGPSWGGPDGDLFGVTLMGYVCGGLDEDTNVGGSDVDTNLMETLIGYGDTNVQGD